MRIDEFNGARDDIENFASSFDKPIINTRVQQQAARKNPKWAKTLTGLMAKHGFALVGAGVNGAVFQNPKHPYVLKVYRTDKMFDEWLHFVRTHQNNPYVPKLKGNTLTLNSVFKAVRMEPLVPCDAQKANAFIETIENTLGYYTKVKELKEENPHLGDIAGFLNDWEQAFDLTAHNVMERQDGTPVIIDPLYLEPGQEIDW